MRTARKNPWWSSFHASTRWRATSRCEAILVLLKGAKKHPGRQALDDAWQQLKGFASVKTESEPVVKKELLSSSLHGLVVAASPTMDLPQLSEVID